MGVYWYTDYDSEERKCEIKMADTRWRRKWKFLVITSWSWGFLVALISDIGFWNRGVKTENICKLECAMFLKKREKDLHF